MKDIERKVEIMANEELYIGSHVSMSGPDYYLGAVKEALSYEANTFMFYTGAPQNTARIPINKDLTKKAFDLMKEKNIDIKKSILKEKNGVFSIFILT